LAKNLKVELVKEITNMKKPTYVEGTKRAVDSDEVMIPEKELN